VINCMVKLVGRTSTVASVVNVVRRRRRSLLPRSSFIAPERVHICPNLSNAVNSTLRRNGEMGRVPGASAPVLGDLTEFRQCRTDRRKLKRSTEQRPLTVLRWSRDTQAPPNRG